MYQNGYISCLDDSRGVSYASNINDSYVGDGYPNSQDEVGCIQGLLDKLGASLAGDGIYGPLTHNAIVNFQQAYPTVLTKAGIAEPKTFKRAAFLAFSGPPIHE